MIISFPRISHHIARHYHAPDVLGEEDEKNEFHAKWWITIARVYTIKTA